MSIVAFSVEPADYSGNCMTEMTASITNPTDMDIRTISTTAVLQNANGIVFAEHGNDILDVFIPPGGHYAMSVAMPEANMRFIAADTPDITALLSVVLFRRIFVRLPSVRYAALASGPVLQDHCESKPGLGDPLTLAVWAERFQTDVPECSVSACCSVRFVGPPQPHMIEFGFDLVDGDGVRILEAANDQRVDGHGLAAITADCQLHENLLAGATIRPWVKALTPVHHETFSATARPGLDFQNDP